MTGDGGGAQCEPCGGGGAASGEDMVSLGSFRAGTDGRVRVTLARVDPAGARFVDVSVERDDGDPTHSRRSVLRWAALS